MCVLDKSSSLLLREDGLPLKTKLVATIGTPALYEKEGSEDLQFKKIGRASDDYFVEHFYLNGVDVLRLNCSHVAVEDVQDRYLAIRSAILKCEQKSGRGKRMTVLADLPGPKIRFQIPEEAPVSVKLGDRFEVHFGGPVRDGRRQTVFVDDKPLRLAMEEAERKSAGNPACSPELVHKQSEFAANVIGCLAGNMSGSGFDKLMDDIRGRLQEPDPLLVFVGDGEVVLRVTSARAPDSLNCEVLALQKPDGMTLEGNKGFTLKGIDIDVPSFTETDEKLLHELLQAEYGQKAKEGDGWEPVLGFVALSFVQTADDVLRARESLEKCLATHGLRDAAVRLESPALVTKIETRKGVRNRNFILDIADAVMVARGDLGMQMKIEDVPRIQKELITLCNQRGKPVITATEMLKGMTDSVEPTRAEVTDVYNAILDGTDAVMLSGESAKGRFPFHAVRKMVSIAERAELQIEMKGTSLIPAVDEERRKVLQRQRLVDLLHDDFARIKENEQRLKTAASVLNIQTAMVMQTPGADDIQKGRLEWRRDLYLEKLSKAQRQETTNRITQGACTLTEAAGTKAIVAPSASGRTARMISRLRPCVPIVAVAHDVANMRKLLLSYGVIPVWVAMLNGDQSVNDLIAEFRKAHAMHPFLRDWLQKPDKVIFTAGTPVRTPGTTNLVQSLDI